MVRVNHVYRICYQNNITPNNLQCHMHFPFVPDSLLIEHLKLSCGIHSFSLNLNFDFLEIITLFQIEWPDRTSQVSMETVAFAVFCPV